MNSVHSVGAKRLIFWRDCKFIFYIEARWLQCEKIADNRFVDMGFCLYAKAPNLPVKIRAAAFAVSVLLASAPSPACAYGLDGMFGGRPNPDGSVGVYVPLQTDQAPDRAQSVLDHPRPDYDPVPLRVGSFLVSPAVAAGVSYNSNIYGTPQAVSDDIYVVQPSVTATSDWNRHFLQVTANGDLNYYQQHSSQNVSNTVFQADGRYDIANQTWLAGSGGYQKQFVPRADLNNSTSSQPETFNLYSAGASAYRGAGMIRAQLDYNFDRYDYSSLPDGSVGLNTYNHDENKIGGKLIYAVSDDFKPYLSTQYNVRSYDQSGAQSSNGYKADIGAAWDFGGITSIDIYTGWLSQDYSSFGAGTVNGGLDFGGKLTWNVTTLTTVVLDSNRSVEESTISGFDSFMATGGSATVTHELRRNILLEADAAYAVDDYKGFSTRRDDVTNAGGGARWLINRHLYSDLDYSWSHRSSSVEQQGFVDHLVIAKLGLRF